MHDRLLRKLAEKEEWKYADVREPAKDQALADLAAAGLARDWKDGRKRLVALTPAGREAVAALAAAAPAAPAPAPRRAAAPRADDDRLGRIEASLARIEAALGRLVPEPPPPNLRDAILRAIADIDGESRHGGLVPLPTLRRFLRARGAHAADAEVNEALEALEREYVVDLSVAQSPTTVADRSAGIERPGRGLIYYVVRRQG